MKTFDIVIVGAGPAGASLAYELKPGYRVLLLEKTKVDQELFRGDKPCGGLLNRNAQKALSHLGIPLDPSILQEPQVTFIRAIDIDNGRERLYPRDYINMDRRLFDRMLLRRALSRPNVELMDQTALTGLGESQDGVLLTLNHGRETVQAKAVVGADGALSTLRSLLPKEASAPTPPKVYASVQEWHRAKRPLNHYAAVFDQRVSDFYSWVIPKGELILIGSAIPKDGRSAKEAFGIFKKDLQENGILLGEPLKTEGSAILKPHVFGSISEGYGRAFLIGEAAGLISPSGAEGISFALLSGEALARAFDSSLEPQRVREAYRKKLWKLKLKIGAKALKSQVMYRPLPRGLVFQTGLLSIKEPAT